MNPSELWPVGTLIRWHSSGSTYRGIVLGVCSYDLVEPPNAYMVRYIAAFDNQPNRPYAIVALTAAELCDDEDLEELGPDYGLGAYWSATPDDRIQHWDHVRQLDGRLQMVPRTPIG